MDRNEFVTCPLCGYRYENSPEKCVRCPMGRNCKVLCCPHCGYQVVDDTSVKEALYSIRRFFSWVKQKILKMKS